MTAVSRIGIVLMIAVSSDAYAQADLTGTELITMAEKVRAFVPRDQFDSPPTVSSLEGRRFSYMIEPLPKGPDNRICDGFGSWGYWPENSYLEMGMIDGTLWRNSFMSAQGPTLTLPPEGKGRPNLFHISFFSLSCTKTREKTTGTNGFGAVVEIEKSDETMVAIAVGEDTIKTIEPRWSTTLSGTEARELIKRIKLMVSGTLSIWSDGRTLVCGHDYRAPTTSFPLERMSNICAYRGMIDRFEIIDSGDGKILYTSARATDPK